jgi:dolichol-phosphate mannosyltransferase
MKAITIRTPLVLLIAVKDTKMFRFGVIGGMGTVANVGLMTVLVMTGMDYLVAAVIASEATIIGNFICHERWVFARLEPYNGTTPTRFVRSFTFNNVETLMRMPVLWLLVERVGIISPVAQLQTLIVAFIARYAFHSRVIYSTRRAE